MIEMFMDCLQANENTHSKFNLKLFTCHCISFIQNILNLQALNVLVPVLLSDSNLHLICLYDQFMIYLYDHFQIDQLKINPTKFHSYYFIESIKYLLFIGELIFQTLIKKG